MGAQFVVGILTPAISFLFALVFYVFWRKRRDLHYVKQFAISYLLVGLSFAQISIIPASHSALSLALSASLGLLSILVSCNAFLFRHNVKKTDKHLTLFWVFGTVGALIAGVVYENATHVAIAGCAMASLMFFTLGFKLQKLESKSLVDEYVPKVLFGTASAIFIQNAYIIYMNPVVDLNTFLDSAIWISLNMIIIMQCCAVAVAVAMIAVTDSMTIASDQAMIDELSGLQRRERFEESTLEAIDKARRGGVPVSLIVCDLDHFKAVNDTYGHLAGDEVIKKFGCIMQATARSTDILGRIGGEEFALLLWNADANGANLVAQQLRTALSQSDLSEFVKDTKCTASFGVSQWNGRDTYRDLFALADKALYHAKHSGRDCVKVAQAKTEVAA